tara:strand:- start:221 stop:364 length:144 start_codon:yes stop_codon:yes gene_type:complete
VTGVLLRAEKYPQYLTQIMLAEEVVHISEKAVSVVVSFSMERLRLDK